MQKNRRVTLNVDYLCVWAVDISKEINFRDQMNQNKEKII